ncbi:flavin monoamine oxidase family protein [Marimonas lutisalis]|uniref:flavin monoamine oxidase family protein n=1 Tax=Marimonas lutisalis TaxID=2545756 RepID=UPI0010F4E51A|nr:FAD-dependent oxidoreductase [Marimonas lutisalis]
MKTEVAIVGGGLAGLALADRLHNAGVEFQLFEARSRLGGRISALNTPTGKVDLGPSWFWPGQPRIAGLIEDLGLRAFPQYSAGDQCFEDESGTVHRAKGFASMEGSFRLEGGMIGLIERLAARLPRDRLNLLSHVNKITQNGMVLLNERMQCQAEHIILALPPRVAAKLQFEPMLAPDVMQALSAIPTWMAGHAKFVAVYDNPFWRAAGYSGDAMSRRGPLAEIHDASGVNGTPAALFGFLGVPAAQRFGRAEEIKAAALQQLARIFGSDAMRPVTTALMDWAFEAETATDRDHNPPGGHPSYGLPPALEKIWDARLQFASTEIASDMGGLMEGALYSAERVSAQILGARTQDYGAS